jgi:hypothetical protein
MNQLLHLEDKIRITTAALGRLESELPRHPESRALRANAMSLRRLHENLRKEYDHVAANLGIDLCHYRLLEDRPTATALARSIEGYQETFSMTYDAQKYGPKQIRTVSPQALATSELHAAYTYPGSFGIVFAIRNRDSDQHKLFVVQSDLEKAAATVMDIAKVGRNQSAIREASRLLGKGTIAALYNWSHDNTKHGTGVAIDWRREGETRKSALIQPAEFAAVVSNIEETAETESLEFRAVGTLVGADTQRKSFRFLPDGEDRAMTGRFDDAISASQEATVPHRYKAIIKRTITRSLAIEKEKPSYFLIALEESLDKPTLYENEEKPE